MTLKLNNIDTAIYSDLSTDAGLVALGVTVHRVFAPQKKVYPYIVWNEVAITPSNNFTGRYWEIVEQFDCYAQKTATQAAKSVASDVVDALCAAMDSADYTITGYQHVCNRYEFSQPVWEEEAEAMRVIVQYRIIIGA